MLITFFLVANSCCVLRVPPRPLANWPAILVLSRRSTVFSLWTAVARSCDLTHRPLFM
jgi:hypothetical protein